MRISDWSSDVCSSDLISRPSRGSCRSRARPTNFLATPRRSTTSERIFCVTANSIDGVQALGAAIEAEVAKAVFGQAGLTRMVTVALLAGCHVLLEGPPGTAKTLLAQAFARAVGLDYGRIQRSEEHTSELQSLMRISYAVLCL